MQIASLKATIINLAMAFAGSRSAKRVTAAEVGLIFPLGAASETEEHDTDTGEHVPLAWQLMDRSS